MLMFYLNVHVTCLRTIKCYPESRGSFLYRCKSVFRLNEITQSLYVRTVFIAMSYFYSNIHL